jgi:hypothetical protein
MDLGNHSIMLHLDQHLDELNPEYLYVHAVRPVAAVTGAINGPNGAKDPRWFCQLGFSGFRSFKSADEAETFLKQTQPLLLRYASPARIAEFSKRDCITTGKSKRCSSLVSGRVVLLGDAGAPPVPGTSTRRDWRLLGAAVGIGAVLLALMFAGLVPVDPVWLSKRTTVVIVGLAAAYFTWAFGFAGLDAVEKRRMGVVAILFVSSAMFWAGYEQAGSSLALSLRSCSTSSSSPPPSPSSAPRREREERESWRRASEGQRMRQGSLRDSVLSSRCEFQQSKQEESFP